MLKSRVLNMMFVFLMVLLLLKGTESNTYISSLPLLTDLHENTDIQTDLWAVSGKVNVEYSTLEYRDNCSPYRCVKFDGEDRTCAGCHDCEDDKDCRRGRDEWYRFWCYKCTDEKDCDRYSLDDHGNSIFYMKDNNVLKRACSDTSCSSCSIGDYCGTGGNMYTYAVSCSSSNRWNYDSFSSETATKKSHLQFYSDNNPTFSFAKGTSVLIGKSIGGSGQVINLAQSVVASEINDNDFIRRFYRDGGSNPPWLNIESSGNIKVIGSVALETSSSLTVKYCVEDRRKRSNCDNLGITIYSTQMTSAPHTYELHENADPAIALFDVTATCDITWTCGSYTCSDSVSCDNCWVENTDNLFYVSGMTVYKKECLKKLCNTCSITDFCATGNTEYTYTVYCDKRNMWIDRPGFTTGTASGTHKLKFKADIDPPFMFNDNFKNSITVGSSIEGDGQKVNQIISNPKNEANDHDTIKFYINDGYRAYWLTVEENTGYVKVSSPLTTETNQIFRTEMCAENRRGLKACQWLNIRVYFTSLTNEPFGTILHENTDAKRYIWNVTATCDITHTCHAEFTCSETHACDSCTVYDSVELLGIDGFRVYKRECNDKFCHKCGIHQHCVNAGEDYDYIVSCKKLHIGGYTDFTSGTAVLKRNLSFKSDIIPPFNYSEGYNVTVFKNDSTPGKIINKIISNPIDETDDNDRIFYYHKSGPRQSWIHWNILFELDINTGYVKLIEDLAFEFSYTFEMELCVRNRRNFTNSGLFGIVLWSCYQTPNCTNQTIPNLWDTHGITHHNPNNSLFKMIYEEPNNHFPNFRNNWAKLTWYLDNGGFKEATINPYTGEIYLTRNISIWPSYPNRNYTMNVTVMNSESCYATSCLMDVTIWYTNWPPHIESLPDKMELHEDTDNEVRLHYLQVYDYNYDRPSDKHAEEDNATCWIQYVHDQWGENDMELFSLRQENPSYLNNWDSYTLWKNECRVPGSPYSPPCGYKRENYTCPKHSGCMTHNVTQWYNVSIVCRDGYGATDNRNFTFEPTPNMRPYYINLPNHRDLDKRKGSAHDIIFSTIYTDPENENLTYEYTFISSDYKNATRIFRGDASGNYSAMLGNISLTTYLYDVEKNANYSIMICGHERRNEICDELTVTIKDYCEEAQPCSSATNTVNESIEVGTPIFDVSQLWTNNGAIDVTYTMTANKRNVFQINRQTGVITTTVKLPASYPSTTYTLNAFLDVTDASHCTAYTVCPLILHVTYINSPVEIKNMPASASIHEDETRTLTLWTIETTDGNADDEVTCVITNPTENKPFYITETFKGSNVYVLKNYVAGTYIERQLSSAKTLYNIDINCTDRLGEGNSSFLQITVNLNQPPQLTTLKGTVHKNVDQSTKFKGYTIITEKASDTENDQLIYSCSNVASKNPLSCDIDDNTLHVKLRRNVSVASENGAEFSIEICVTDGKNSTKDCGTLEVTFTTTHTHPKISNLPKVLEINENEGLGGVIFTAIADDDDSGETHTFSMKVNPSLGSNYFSLDPYSGNVILTRYLDYEDTNTFYLIFSVKDDFLSSQDSYTLVIKVRNVNEQNKLTSEVKQITFKQTTKIGRSWRTGLTCTDIDNNDEQTIVIDGGEHADFFRYNASNNKLYLAKVWNLDDASLMLPDNTLVTMKCTDTGGLVSRYNFVVNVVAVNTIRPVIDKERCVQEMTEIGMPVIRLNSKTDLSTSFCSVRCQENGSSSGNVCKYSILGNGLGRKYFETRMQRFNGRKRRTDKNSAGLFLRQPIDLTYNKDFVLHLKVTDGGTPPLFSVSSFAVKYTAIVPPPKTAEASSSLTSSSSGILMIVFLSIEIAIMCFLTIHTVYNLFYRGKDSVTSSIEIARNTKFNTKRLNSAKHKPTRPNYRAKSTSSKSLSIMGNSNIVHSNVASGLRQPSRSAQFGLNSDSSSSSSDESDFESRPVPRRISHSDLKTNSAQMGFRHVYSSQSKPVANSLYPGQLRSNIGLPAPIYSSQVNSIYASNELPGAI